MTSHFFECNYEYDGETNDETGEWIPYLRKKIIEVIDDGKAKAYIDELIDNIPWVFDNIHNVNYIGENLSIDSSDEITMSSLIRENR